MLTTVGLLLLAAGLAVLLSRRGGRADVAAAATHRDWRLVETLARAALAKQPNDAGMRRQLALAQLQQARHAEGWSLYKDLAAEQLEAVDWEALRKSLADAGNVFLARVFAAQPGERGDHGSTTQNDPHAGGQAADATAVLRKLSAFERSAPRQSILLSVLDPCDPKGGPPAQLAAALLDAFEHVNIAYAAPGNSREAPRIEARTALSLGRYAEALHVLEDRWLTKPDDEYHWLLSRALLGVGRIREAEAALAQSKNYHQRDEFAADPAPYIGAAACAACHARYVTTQQHSRHALSFLTGDQAGAIELPQGLRKDSVNSEVSHSYQSQPDGIEAVTSRDGREYRARVAYAFGSGRHGVTFVGVDQEGRMRELRLSKYADGAWDRTTGHAPQPAAEEDYLGRLLTWKDVHACLSCHTTEVRSARDHSGAAASDRGIGCERCHGPGANHVLAVNARFSDMAIALPAGARAARITQLCGQCHKPSGASTADPINETGSARFQAATLPLSRCYNPAGTEMTCVTCHNPHADLKHSAEFYTERCLNCHGRKATGVDKAQRPCPVAAENCVSCHMPKVESTTSRTRFTDHHIRLHPELEKSARACGDAGGR